MDDVQTQEEPGFDAPAIDVLNYYRSGHTPATPFRSFALVTGLVGFAVCCGWVIVASRFLPRWLGWLAILVGIGFVLSRIEWTSGLWLLPYGVFWLWVVTVSVMLLIRNFRNAPEPR